MDLKSSNNKGGSQSPLEFNKKAIIAASVIVGVLLLVGVSYGVYYKVSGTSKKVQTTNTPNTVNTNTSNLPVNATDWKTFSDKGLGFEIKYPSNWSYTNEGGIVNFKETGKQYLIEGSESVPVSVSVLDSVGNDTSLDRANKRNRYNGSVKSLTVAGQNAAEVKDYLGIETYIVYSGSVYVVATPNFGEEKTDTSIHNVYSEMLKTLKFLEKSSNVSDWQTYKNTRIGFEFEHPRDLRVKENTTKQTNAFGKPFLELKSDGSALNLLIYVNDEGRGFENFITNVSSEEIQIDGVTASLDIADEPASGETEPRRGYFVTFEKNSNNFFLLFSYKKSGEEQDKTIRKILSTFKFVDHSVSDKTTYFGKGSEKNYSLVNVTTGDTKDFISEGYEVVDQHSYNPFPEILILQKGNKLFSYSVSSDATKEILVSGLKTSEMVKLSPSISEKDKFYIVINDTKSVEEGMFAYEIIGSRKYFFDASKNTIESANDITLSGVSDNSGCYEYDSKYSRFFIWQCGEGIGTSIPLSYMNITDQKTKVVVSLSEFGFGKDDIGIVALEYNNGLFFALAKEKIDKIIVIDPASKEPSKTIYALNAQIKKDVADKSYSYSVAMDKESNTIVIGGDTFVTLLKFDQNNLITKSSVISEEALYANFIFTHQGILYYQSRNSKALQVVNLNNWQKEKSIPVIADEEITLFAM